MSGWQIGVLVGTVVCIAASATITGKYACDCFDGRRYWAGVGWTVATVAIYFMLWLLGALTVDLMWPW